VHSDVILVKVVPGVHTIAGDDVDGGELYRVDVSVFVIIDPESSLLAGAYAL